MHFFRKADTKCPFFLLSLPKILIMIDTSKLKYCRLYKGTKEVPEILNFNLQYACYAELFYCRATEEEDEKRIKEMEYYKISTSDYRDMPLALIAHLFSVWSNKLSGGSHPDIVVPGFHNRFMKAYLLANKEDGLLDMWFVPSNYDNFGHRWSYYLDKCIYFKGTVLTPDSIIKADKQYIARYEYEWIMMHYPSEYEHPTKEEQDGWLKEMIAKYKAVGLSQYRKDDGVAISLKAYLFNEKGCNVEAFKQWYETEYYSYNAFTLISKDYLLQLTLAYKGEEECPAEYDGQFMGKIWLAESVAVENLLNTSNQLSKEWGFEFYKMVAMLIEKWSPYDYMSILDFYFQDFVEFKKKVYKEAFGIIM